MTRRLVVYPRTTRGRNPTDFGRRQHRFAKTQRAEKQRILRRLLRRCADRREPAADLGVSRLLHEARHLGGVAIPRSYRQ